MRDTVLLTLRVVVLEWSTGDSKRPFSKAAVSEETRRTLRYVEPLSDARTPLAGFFSILLRGLFQLFQGGRVGM